MNTALMARKFNASVYRDAKTDQLF